MDTERLTADELAAMYIKLRTERAVLAEEYEQKDGVLKEKMDGITDQLMAICKEQNASSIRTAHGTIIRSITTRYWTNDWAALHKVVVDWQAPYLLEKRIHNSAMKEFLQEHPEAMPTGLNVDNRYAISVRKPRG